MKDKQKFSTKKLLLLLAIVSFLVAALEGCLYYAEKPAFFRILLILQNSINAFAFKPTITLTNAIDLMAKNQSTLYTVVGYAYGAAVFTAPYCTIAMVYKVLERLMRGVITLRRRKRGEHIFIFGFNDDVRAMLQNYDCDAHKNQCIHIISDYQFDSEERYACVRQGIHILDLDILRMEEKDLHKQLKKALVDQANHIILFEENPVSNFSLLQIFSLHKDDGGFPLKSGAKITCRCEDPSIGELISDHFQPAEDGSYGYDLELVSIPELQVRRMFSEFPLHSFYVGSSKPLSEWHTHILLIGFGTIGQQALLQAINLGVMHQSNRIVMDVYDTNIDLKMGVFVNRFHPDSIERDGQTIRFRSDTSDGELVIHCHKTDVRASGFFDGIREAHCEMPFTYVVTAIDDVSIGVHCAMRLSRIFSESGAGETPILVRMDSDRRLAEYINQGQGTFTDVRLLEERSVVLTLDIILNREINSMAKHFHHLYSEIQVVSKGESGWDSGTKTEDEFWNSTSLFRRESSKALASHSSVKQVILEQLAKELKLPDVDSAIAARIGTEGSLMTCDGKVWQLREDEAAFVKALNADAFAHTVAAMEHRRWCYFVLSVGWRSGSPRNDARKVHNCLVPFDALCADEKGRSTVKYDLMALMQRYQEQ